jgi:hypothetical protein
MSFTEKEIFNAEDAEGRRGKEKRKLKPALSNPFLPLRPLRPLRFNLLTNKSGLAKRTKPLLF